MTTAKKTVGIFMYSFSTTRNPDSNYIHSYRPIVMCTLKVHKIENFFCSDLCYFIVSYAQIIRFCKKHFLIRPLLGEIQLFRLV
jgi:hypothetical protein